MVSRPFMDSDSDTLSGREEQEEYDMPEEEHYRHADSKRRVTIILKDARDITGKGMTDELPWLAEFKKVFDHFKARSCKNCRAPSEMRFKTMERLVSEYDTPKSLKLWHGTTTEIRVWSNVPGLQCKSCKSGGYPKTVGLNKLLHLTPAIIPASLSREKPETITLLAHDQTGFETSIKMINTVPFTYLMDQYTAVAVRDRSVCRFSFDGERLMEDETPKKLGMINNDRIEVFFEQIGG